MLSAILSRAENDVRIVRQAYDLGKHTIAFQRIQKYSDFRVFKTIKSRAGGEVVEAGLLDEDGKTWLKYAIKRVAATVDKDADADRKRMAASERNFSAFEHKKDYMQDRHIRTLHKPLQSHDNIVHYFGSVEDGANVPAMVFELCAGDLTDLINKRTTAACAYFDETDFLLVASDILCALNDLHATGIVHLDVALGNVLYTEYDQKIRLKLADFGLASDCRPASRAKIGKPCLLNDAPEIRNGETVAGANMKMLDAW